MTKSKVCTLCYCNFDIKQPYRIPRKLHCEHTFCTDCIKKLQDLQGQAIECPLCQKTTLIPASGLDALEKNLDIVGLKIKSTEPEKCKHCIHKVFPSKPVTLFCNDCDTFFCGSCSDAEHLKPENSLHSIILSSAKINIEASGSKVSFSHPSHESFVSRSSTGINFNTATSESPSSRPSSSLLLDTDFIPECPVHGEKMRIYCRTDRCLCCTYCETSGEHRGHDCFQVHEAEERERIFLQKLQQKVEMHSERFIKARGDVQQMIEDVKKNSINVKDVVRRYFREMRAAIDSTEKTLVSKLTKKSDNNLKALREQLGKMIHISSIAKTASRNCDNALSFDYYEMLLRRRSVEEEIEAVLQMMVETDPVAKADTHCQFPKHETLLNSIRTCCFMVEAPPPPSNFTCSISPSSNVVLKWNDGENMQYIYPALFYTIQASIGPDNTFVNIRKVKEKTLSLKPGPPSYPYGTYIQFRVAAENIVGIGNFSNPFGIRMPPK
eukprot:gene311-941_t